MTAHWHVVKIVRPIGLVLGSKPTPDSESSKMLMIEILRETVEDGAPKPPGFWEDFERLVERVETDEGDGEVALTSIGPLSFVRFLCPPEEDCRAAMTAIGETVIATAGGCPCGKNHDEQHEEPQPAGMYL